MHKLLAAALLLGLTLTACGGAPNQTKEYDPEATAKALLDGGAFSETLEPLDADLIGGVYGLSGTPTAAVAYTSTGATAEEVVVLVYGDADAAAAGKADLDRRVADQKEACDGYLPLELPKLDKAMVTQAGNSVLLVVANDYVAAKKALDQ